MTDGQASQAPFALRPIRVSVADFARHDTFAIVSVKRNDLAPRRARPLRSSIAQMISLGRNDPRIDAPRIAALRGAGAPHHGLGSRR